MKIEFSEDQLNLLNMAIVELPFRIAQPLITHINREIQKRHTEAVNVVEEKAAPKHIQT